MSQPRLLTDLAGVLDPAGIVWWLSDGAALGCVREGRFLPSDADVDVGIWAADRPAVVRLLAGWEPHPNALDPAWLRYGVKLDLHDHHADGGTVWFGLGAGRYRYRFTRFGFERHRFCGLDVRVPSPADQYLTEHYGPDWRTPRAGWRWDQSPPCLEVADG